jgi:hypothetical protein
MDNDDSESWSSDEFDILVNERELIADAYNVKHKNATDESFEFVLDNKMFSYPGILVAKKEWMIEAYKFVSLPNPLHIGELVLLRNRFIAERTSQLAIRDNYYKVTGRTKPIITVGSDLWNVYYGPLPYM